MPINKTYQGEYGIILNTTIFSFLCWDKLPRILIQHGPLDYRDK